MEMEMEMRMENENGKWTNGAQSQTLTMIHSKNTPRVSSCCRIKSHHQVLIEAISELDRLTTRKASAMILLNLSTRAARSGFVYDVCRSTPRRHLVLTVEIVGDRSRAADPDSRPARRIFIRRQSQGGLVHAAAERHDAMSQRCW